MRDQWIRQSRVFVLAFTLAFTVRPDLLESLQAVYDSITRVKDEPWVPVVVVRTCSDMPADLSQMGAIIQWCAKTGLPFVTTSAATRQNVDETFELCARIYLHTLAPQRRTD